MKPKNINLRLFTFSFKRVQLNSQLLSGQLRNTSRIKLLQPLIKSADVAYPTTAINEENQVGSRAQKYSICDKMLRCNLLTWYVSSRLKTQFCERC